MTFERAALPFMLFLGGLAAVSPLSIDMALPAFLQIGASPGAASDTVGMTVSIFQIFTLAGFGCALSQSAAQLLVARLFQGIEAGAGGVLPFIIVSDLVEGHAARIALPLHRTQRYAAERNSS